MSRPSRGAPRRKPARKPTSGRVRTGKRQTAISERKLLALVQTGIEKFILNKVTVDDFFTAIRAVGDTEKPYSHQLTKAVFSRLVREAMRKRERGQPR